MKKYLFLIMGMALCLASCNNNGAGKVETAQNAGTEATGLRIAYVELDSLMSQYQLYKDYEGVLTRKGADIQNTLGQRQRRLESSAAAMQRKYENNGFVSPERAQQEYQRIQKQQQELEALQQKLMNDLAAENQKNSLELRDSINSFLKVYNQTKGYDLIISNTAFDNLLYGNPAYNITNEIVEGLNARYNPSIKK